MHMCRVPCKSKRPLRHKQTCARKSFRSMQQRLDGTRGRPLDLKADWHQIGTPVRALGSDWHRCTSKMLIHAQEKPDAGEHAARGCEDAPQTKCCISVCVCVTPHRYLHSDVFDLFVSRPFAHACTRACCGRHTCWCAIAGISCECGCDSKHSHI